jgi:hypothetical protein
MLGHWTLFFSLKGASSWILQKRFAAAWAQIIGNVGKIGEALKMVCNANQIDETWYFCQ